ncbi:heavy metal-associated domain-containing protein [Nonomuraea sp. NPDC046802]|uniref:heavy-metal-associated domain-containing protein n=1 Tax=Nonomuraea sp. NPDC046802 TaxID=3154919 RepID=UPI0033F2151F
MAWSSRRPRAQVVSTATSDQAAAAARIAGVTAVAVDVDTGRVSVTSEESLDTEDVRAAVEEAGYELTHTNG